ncbi:DUF4625 domain-containing protein [Chitinophaga rhizophila]|uniref:DUF4625 domain-containing protein n=1 Tax=Chitinophaga rhizophila TaxID=2866212 RepID=A0ABS7GAF2_9BACT|nr:DUF4625 domain-containing protein [Chitinophaga rhizophila]MBW8684640.1 DUF4625 domain-containing protein [Chitinophaga rhizophila]
MKMFSIKAGRFAVILTALVVGLMSSCKKDDEPAPSPAKATISNLEIGSGNNGQAIIGRDFHLEMDVVAGTRIKNIQILIRQQQGQTYEKEWSYEATWDEFSGAKNTNVHKHFDIDKAAVEGTYDFVIRVNDENGSVTEEVHPIKLVSAAGLPVNPELYSFMLQKIGTGYLYILNRGFMLPDDKGFAKNDTVNAFVDIKGVKDDGIIYTLLIRKSANHLPESVQDIDFSKVIVADMREHKAMKELDYFTNYVGMPDFTPRTMVIGATADNHLPVQNPVQGNKSWANGEYYFGVVYTNTTHNISAHYYIPVTLSGF